MKRWTLLGIALGALLVWPWPPGVGGEAPFVTLASTTSTQTSGLFEAILPRFEAETGIEVRVVAVGTGQALRIGRSGDADLVLVHDRAAEERFIEEGFGLVRHELMYNDFVIVGPGDDPAGVRSFADAVRALAQIAAVRATFVSRGDDSGTHKAERRLWRIAGVDPTASSGAWYREVGAGMGSTLNTTAAIGAYTLTDRGTWLSFKNRRELEILVEGDARLANHYAAIAVNPGRHPHVKREAAARLIEWLLSEPGQRAIDNFRIQGQRLFVPSAASGR
ncbi:MAG: extracellular solute-binding protein [Myxococcales bacterium]|nr:extracellular solute-binding protein [Myxococcales bacterium]